MLRINGFEYNRLHQSSFLDEDKESRLPWINKQTLSNEKAKKFVDGLPPFLPQPYTQLENVYKRNGHDAWASNVGMAREERRYEQLKEILKDKKLVGRPKWLLGSSMALLFWLLLVGIFSSDEVLICPLKFGALVSGVIALLFSYLLWKSEDLGLCLKICYMFGAKRCVGYGYRIDYALYLSLAVVLSCALFYSLIGDDYFEMVDGKIEKQVVAQVAGVGSETGRTTTEGVGSSNSVYFWSASSGGLFVKFDEQKSIVPAKRSVDEHPDFNPLLFSIDVFIPVLSLRQVDFWHPHIPDQDSKQYGDLPLSGLVSVFFWVERILGWVLTTFLVLGVTGYAKRN